MADRSANNFDALRLLAAWLVLFSHCYPLVGADRPDPYAAAIGIDTLGGVGVTIFFTLSGYLVAQSYSRSSNVLDFIWRRVRRIYPALIACVLVCALVLGPLVTRLSLREYFSHPLFSAYLETMSGWSIKFALPGVFENTQIKLAVNGSLWSLPYEIACYISLVVIALIPWIAARWKALSVFAILATILALRPDLTAFQQFMGFDFYTTKLGMQFALGASAALWVRTVRFDRVVISLAVATFIAALMVTSTSVRIWLYSLSLPVLVLAAGLYLQRAPKWPSGLGDWSYGLFLWGFPVQQTIVHLGFAPVLGFPGYVLLSTVVSVSLAALSWFLLEKRMNQVSWRDVTQAR
jgi:peptidoglycan/LPS O-acetylase OafA/YrhL